MSFLVFLVLGVFQGLLNPLIATEISGAVLKELVRVADRSVLYASPPVLLLALYCT